MNEKREQIRSWGRKVEVNDVVVIGEQPWRVIRLTTKQAVARRLVAADTLEEPRYAGQAIDRRFDRESGRLVKQPGERWGGGYAEFLGAEETVQGLIDAKVAAAFAESRAREAKESEAQARANEAAMRKIAIGKAAHIGFSEPLHRQPDYRMWLATVETAIGMPMRLLIKVEREKKWTFRDEAEAYELKVEIAGFVPSWYEKTGHSRTDRFTCGDGDQALMDAICEYVGGHLEDIERDVRWHQEAAKAEAEKQREAEAEERSRQYWEQVDAEEARLKAEREALAAAVVEAA